jgi:hypothetical protein
MPRNEKIPLKTFWDAVEQRLSTFSPDELRAILRTMAQDTPPTQRQAFLDKLKPMKETAAAVKKALRQDKLLADIDDLASEIKAAMRNADYWEEDRYEWGDHYDDEEDSLGPYEEFVEPLTALFDRTEAVFDYGNLTLARAAYQKLFGMLNLEDEYGRGVRADDLSSVDIGEARARFLRAVYETEPLADRPKALFEQMRQAPSSFGKPHPALNDIIQISTRPLPDQDSFLKNWIAFLRKQSGSEADAWLREAIRLAQGTQGLEELARTEGKKRPRAFLDWFTALEEEGKHQQVLTAAQQALKTLPAKLPIRAAVADHLYAAAAKLDDTETQRAARWEAFLVQPRLARLLNLWDAAPSDEEQVRVMQQAAEHVKDYLAHPPRDRGTLEEELGSDGLESPAWITGSVLAHSYLLAGEWDAAHQLAAREKVLGWSYGENTQGLVVPFFLMLVSGKQPDALPPSLKKLWQAGLQASVGFEFGSDKEEKSLSKRTERAFADIIPRASLSSDKQEEFLSWCLDVANKRVNAIVSEQHRKSYDKAAVLIAACAETLRQRGKGAEANGFVDDARNRFPRHRAFQYELDAVLPQAKHKR